MARQDQCNEDRGGSGLSSSAVAALGGIDSAGMDGTWRSGSIADGSS